MDVNAQDDVGETPLHWAAFAGRTKEKVLSKVFCEVELGPRDFCFEMARIRCWRAGQARPKALQKAFIWPNLAFEASVLSTFAAQGRSK